jgi:hypothetical protein
MLREYPGIYLEGLKKSTKNFSQERRSQYRVSDSEPPKYEAGSPLVHDIKYVSDINLNYEQMDTVMAF